MKYYTFGKTGLEISKVSLGCSTLSNLYGELDLDEGIKTVQEAIKLGINYIDTAPFYGQGRSEEVLGLALKDVPREAYYIATKVGRYTRNYDTMFDYSAKKTRASVNNSLKKLGLDYVDVVLIHDIEFLKDLDVVINETLPELEKFVKEGKVRYIGLSGYPVSRLKECIERAPGRFTMVLSYSRYTLLDDTLKSYLDFFKKENLGIVCAAGLAMGLLTNSGPQPWHPATNDIKELCQKAANICKNANVELGKLALYYFMQLDGPTTFLTGMQTRPLLDATMSVYYNGLDEKEQEVLKLLRNTVFTNLLHWEGVEVAQYWAALNEIVK